MPADRLHEPPLLAASAPTLNKPRAASGPASLHRNQACLTCRSRKVKCDAVRPACGACRKTARVRNEDPDILVCTYDDGPEDGEPPKSSRVRNAQKVNALENKIAELETLLRTNGPSPPQQNNFPSFPMSQASTSFSMPSAPATQPGYYGSIPVPSLSSMPSPSSFNETTQRLFEVPGASPRSGSSPISSLNTNERAGTLDRGNLAAFVGTGNSGTQTVSGLGTTYAPDNILDDQLFALLYPAWPPDLPNPNLVHSLCELYFLRKSSATGMINQGRFMTQLTLPPSHANFPSTALIHAVCGVACLFNVGNPLDLERETYWTAEVTPAEYHLKMAKIHIDDATVRGKQLFQVAQAIILCCFCSYSQARFVEVWLYSSLATRISTPLGLNHLEGVCQSARTSDGSHTVVKPVLLDPPVDEIERYERAVTFWLAFCCDRFAISNTGWPHSLAEDDITTLLPNELTSTSTGMPAIDHHECLDIRSPSFLSSHPPQMIRSQGMLIKSVVLLSRINCFLQRAPWPIGHRTVARISQVVPDLRDTPAFKRLDADSVAFRLSFPRDLRNAFKKDSQGMIDSNLVLAHQVAHAATILLHESWCTVEMNDPSMQRCITSAKAILAYLVHESAAELALLNPFITHTWSIAGRTLIREMAIQDHHGNKDGAAILRNMIERVLHGLSETARSPLSLTVAGQLRSILAEPIRALPRFGQPYGPKADKFREGCEDLFDKNHPPPVLQPGAGGGTFIGMNIGARPSKARQSVPGSQMSDKDGTEYSSSNDLATPGSMDALEANSFLLELEQGQDAKDGKDLSAEQIRQLLEPWASGSAPSPSAEKYWQMLAE